MSAPTCPKHPHLALRCLACLGREGGQAKSRRKQEAARNNGQQGGRPPRKTRRAFGALALVSLLGLTASCAAGPEYYVKPSLGSPSLQREALMRDGARCEMAALGVPPVASTPIYAPSASPDPVVNTQMAAQGLQNAMAGLGDVAISRAREERMFRACLRALGWARTDAHGVPVDR
jgi:hypothetical protein